LPLLLTIAATDIFDRNDRIAGLIGFGKKRTSPRRCVSPREDGLCFSRSVSKHQQPAALFSQILCSLDLLILLGQAKSTSNKNKPTIIPYSAILHYPDPKEYSYL
jgi:hypothetical protein